MAISYTQVGWDTSKYVNPTNMNQMDNGIKAACDGVDTINGGTITGGTIALTSQIPTQISDLATSFTLPANSSVTLTASSANNIVSFFVYGAGWQVAINSVLFHISGYATASRCTVTNLVTQTNIIVDNSSTSGLVFTITNGTGTALILYALALLPNVSFTIS